LGSAREVERRWCNSSVVGYSPDSKDVSAESLINSNVRRCCYGKAAEDTAGCKEA
jgi:hypothetical protein